jgi:hypothetical protein
LRQRAAQLSRVRPATADDIPGVVRLFARKFPNNGWRSDAACAQYFNDMLFGHPWYDAQIPSWVADSDGAIIGFYGIQSRPMLFRGRPVRVAVGFNFMVDTDIAGGLTAFQLLQAHFSGRQDLTLSDGASAQVLPLWTRVGGHAPLAYNLHWVRLLRPASYALRLLGSRGPASRAVSLAARPLAVAADTLGAHLRPNRFFSAAPAFAEEPLSAATIGQDFAELTKGKALQPVYDASSFDWLLRQAADKPRGELRARRVLDGGRLLGWYIYFLGTRGTRGARGARNKQGTSEMVQLVAREGAYDTVLQALLIDAWRHGAQAVRGRLDPDAAQPLSLRHCWLRWDEPVTLIHSRDPQIVAAIERGDAFLSRLEGEWWMRFASG